MAKSNGVFPALRKSLLILAAALSFLVCLVTLGIILTPILAVSVVLLMWNREGARRVLPQRHKSIVIGAVLLILLASLFPPYREAKLDSEGALIGTYTEWEFNRPLIDLIESVTNDKPVEVIEYMPRHDIIRIEIIGILALAGAAYLITKKRQ